MLELAILGLLKEQELHGYELKKRLGDTLGARSGVSYGSLYPALGRLENAGAVKAVESATSVPIPLTGSLGGELAAFRARHAAIRGSRGKKVYGITDRGEELFGELLTAQTASAEDEREFNLRLAFARYLPPQDRLGLLERRRAHLVERLGRLSARIRTGRDRLDGYARSLLEHDRETVEHDLNWIERLIATERLATERLATERSAAERPATERLATEPPAREGSTVLPTDGTVAPMAAAATTPFSPTTVSPTPAVPEHPYPTTPIVVGSDRPSLSGLRPTSAQENRIT